MSKNYVPCRDMESALRYGEEFEGNSVTAQYVNGVYTVLSYSTTMIRVKDGEVVYFDPRIFSRTTTKIQWLLVRVFNVFGRLEDWKGVRRTVNGKPQMDFHYVWEKRLGVNIYCRIDRSMTSAPCAILHTDGRWFVLPNPNDWTQKIYGKSDPKHAKDVIENLITAMVV